MRRILLWVCLSMWGISYSTAQELPVVIEAEYGNAGSDWEFKTSAGLTSVFPKTDRIADNYPASVAKVITFTVTFPKAGTYHLYAKLRTGGANDDSFFYAKSFGSRNPGTDNNEWVTCNGLASVGYIYLEPPIVVEGAGNGSSEIWKWINLSRFNGGEIPVSFTVNENNLTQTFQIGSRENGFEIDKIAFGLSGKYFTVENLDKGQAGADTKPEPVIPTSSPIASGASKYIGQVYSGSESQTPYFANYWNQVAPGNGGKWGTIESTRDVMNWSECDKGLKLATDNGFPFRFHVLVWGRQQPAWVASLPPAEQLEELKEWFQAVAARYPNLEMVEVVNEPTNAPPTTGGADYGNYKEALGGDGVTGWDWVLNAFRLARQYFPATTKLMINEYHLENQSSTRSEFIKIVNLLKAENLVDAIGTQGHSFSLQGSAASIKTALDQLGATDIPIYVTEMDLDGINTATGELDDLVQLNNYKRVFPVYWNHPKVKGITFHGWRVGQWRTNQGAFLIYSDNTERPALQWLRSYVASTLPVTLVSFTGRADVGTNTLTWQTTSESISSHFEVMRSHDGSNFTSLAKLVTGGSSRSLKSYYYVDREPMPGPVYYQLKQVDLNGKSVFFGPVVIKNSTFYNDVKIVPSDEALSVRYSSGKSQQASFVINDVSGRKIAQIKCLLNIGSNEISIPLSLAPGIYLLGISTDEYSLSKKFIK
ncbi:endo-1,4-beta-xylanase [Desertivirga xinjiangensis]|uniref:endo-1,4-beta-xylanase n=1 Tax=Desertivirga xinjiangensis TaxID=539206 RepID=UPI00210ABBC6|nr:endo-1,4-beta-xylanase [Pedobacter xinjiangensis]